MTATAAPPCYTVTRESMGDALASHPLTEHLTPERRERMADALLAQMPVVPGDALARLAELENAIGWNTSCTSCATVLDSSIREHERAERAEEKVAAVRILANQLGDRSDEPAAAAPEVKVHLPVSDRRIVEPVRRMLLKILDGQP